LAFLRDDCAEHAAALAYYTVFSLPPLLLIAVAVAGSLVERSAVVSTIFTEVNGTLGERAAQQVVEALVAAQRSDAKGSLPSVLSLIALGFSATGAFNQLQASLNRIWEVKPDPQQSEVRSFLAKRLISFGMVLSLGFLLMASLLLSAALTAFAGVASYYLPSGISAAFLSGLNNLLSIAAFAGLFAAMFHMLPDARVEWRDSLVGGLATSILFTGGKALIGAYLGKSELSNAYGAAGSLAIILAWTYYASMIVLLGAELTRAWAQRHGRVPTPEAGAMRVKQREVRVV
jgi:membrane protein